MANGSKDIIPVGETSLIEDSKTLFNSYVLNEIQSYEDSARQNISIAFISLLGIYLSLITNREYIQTILTASNNKWLLFIIILLPVLPWILGIFFSWKALKPNIENKNLNLSSGRLKEIMLEKNKSMRNGFIIFLFMLLLIVMILISYLSYNYVTPEKGEFDKGVALFLEGNDDEYNYYKAIEAFDKAIDLNPKSADAWRYKGKVLAKQGKYSLAIEAINKSIDLDPSNKKAWYDIGNAYYSRRNCTLRDLDKALEAFDEALEIDTSYTNAWIAKGNTLLYMQKYEEAVQAYDEAIILDPRNEDALVNKRKALEKCDLRINL